MNRLIHNVRINFWDPMTTSSGENVGGNGWCNIPISQQLYLASAYFAFQAFLSFLVKKIKEKNVLYMYFKYLDFKMNLIVFFHFLKKRSLPWKKHELENFSELKQLPERALECLFFSHQVLDAVKYSIPKTQISVCV